MPTIEERRTLSAAAADHGDKRLEDAVDEIYESSVSDLLFVLELVAESQPAFKKEAEETLKKLHTALEKAAEIRARTT